MQERRKCKRHSATQTNPDHIHNRICLYDVSYLKLGASTQQYIKSLQVVLIRKDLNYAINQIKLCKLIFTIDDLLKKFKVINPTFMVGR